MQVKKIIDLYGHDARLAKKIGVSTTTVMSFKKSDTIWLVKHYEKIHALMTERIAELIAINVACRSKMVKMEVLEKLFYKRQICVLCETKKHTMDNIAASNKKFLPEIHIETLQKNITEMICDIEEGLVINPQTKEKE